MCDTKIERSYTHEDIDSLPPLEDLFDGFQGDEFTNGLEELAESLLREVTSGVEASSQKPNEQVIINFNVYTHFYKINLFVFHMHMFLIS